MDVNQVKRLEQLQVENREFEQMVAGLGLETRVLEADLGNKC